MAGFDADPNDPMVSDEHLLHAMVHRVRDYAIYALSPTGIVRTWNAGAQRIKGWTAEEIVGQHFSRFYPPEDRESGLPERCLQAAKDNGSFEAEAVRIRKDGSKFVAHVVIDAILDDRGVLVGFTKIVRDVTDAKESQSTQSDLREALWQAQRLEAVGKLAGGVAHDFNNLLTVILNSLEMAHRLAINEKVKTHISTAELAASRGARLTAQLLSFSRQHPIRPERIRPEELLRNNADFLKVLRDDIMIVLDISNDLGVIEVDRAEMEMALLNIGMNAKEAMPAGGTITISAKLSKLDDETSHPKLGTFLQIDISDTGHGIKKELLGRVLEPFFTTKPIGKGSGLGLSQAYGFAAQAGGFLRIASTVDAGTTISIYLPSCQAAAPEKQKAILVVDDDEHLLKVLAEVLTDEGYNVTDVDKPDVALATMATQAAAGEKFDLVLTDVKMPVMSGIEMAQIIRQIDPLQRILLMSGYSDGPELAKATHLQLVTKPYRIHAMLQAIERALKDPAFPGVLSS